MTRPVGRAGAGRPSIWSRPMAMRPQRRSNRSVPRTRSKSCRIARGAGGAPGLQNPGGHQAPPDHPGAGGQGRARQQGRGADDLPLARRPLLRADAEHGARRRHLAQDHQATDRKRLKEIAGELEVPEGMGLIIRTAGAQRTKTEIKRDYEYLLAAVGNRPRPDAEIDRAGLVYEEGSLIKRVDPRSLQQGHRRSAGRRRRRLSRRQGLHAHADAEPCQEREALQGAGAALHPLSGRAAARCHVHRRR